MDRTPEQNLYKWPWKNILKNRGNNIILAKRMIR